VPPRASLSSGRSPLSGSTASRCRVARSAAWVPSRGPGPQAYWPYPRCSPWPALRQALGTQDGTPATDERPRRDRPPHRPALQGRPQASLQLTGIRPQGLSPHRHTFAPCPPRPRRTSLAPEKPGHRETTRGTPPHPTGIIPPTAPATPPPTPTQPDNGRSRITTTNRSYQFSRGERSSDRMSQ